MDTRIWSGYTLLWNYYVGLSGLVRLRLRSEAIARYDYLGSVRPN